MIGVFDEGEGNGAHGPHPHPLEEGGAAHGKDQVMSKINKATHG